VAGYIVLIKTCGESFDQEPKSRKILTNPGLDGDEKIERLFHAGSGNPTP
jgi:hypothetical protein